MKKGTTLVFNSEIPYGESINVVQFFFKALFILQKILKNCNERLQPYNGRNSYHE